MPAGRHDRIPDDELLEAGEEFVGEAVMPRTGAPGVVTENPEDKSAGPELTPTSP